MALDSSPETPLAETKALNRPLRIAMVIDVWDDPANGAVVSTRRFTELLRERGHTVTVLAGGVAAPGKIVLPPFTIPLAEEIMRKMRFLFAWPDRSVLATAFAKHELVHVQMPFYLGMRAVAIARTMGRPVVSTFHVLAENVLHNAGIRSQTMVDLLYRLWLRTFFNRSDHVICPSAFAEAELRSHGAQPWIAGPDDRDLKRRAGAVPPADIDPDRNSPALPRGRLPVVRYCKSNCKSHRR